MDKRADVADGCMLPLTPEQELRRPTPHGGRRRRQRLQVRLRAPGRPLVEAVGRRLVPGEHTRLHILQGCLDALPLVSRRLAAGDGRCRAQPSVEPYILKSRQT